jgi:hypothetical protein
MSTVAAMHEDMHQRACQHEKIGQHAEHMRLVLGQQKEPDDRQETDQYNPHAPRAMVSRAVMASLLAHVAHGALNDRHGG